MAAAAGAAEDDAPRSAVLSRLAEDLPAADLRWSLFVAALRSYRYDSVLRPFPAAFFADRDTKQVEELRRLAARVPPLASLLSDDADAIPPDAWRLLRWVLGGGPDNGGVRVRSATKADVPQLERSPVDHVFQVSQNAQADRRFEAAKGDRDVFYAYHGSRLDNFYSILHNGLLAHMNKNSLFGTGTYLSSELDVSATFSPVGYGWQHSCLGPELSCVAMCEVVDHPDVKCQDRGRSRASRAYADDSLAGKVPERYYLVQNNSVVRVRYLLVYTSSRTATPDVLPVGPAETRICAGPVVAFLRRNKSALVILAYVALLVAVGLSGSRTGQQLVRRFFRTR